MKDAWTKFLCWFIGWDYKLLSECSTASKKALHRYAGAVFLLMLIWAYIGYGMADRYFKVEQVSVKIAVAIVFSLAIWMIERQIILIVGKNKAISWMRFGLAVITALIGSTIIDQTIFGKDIEAQVTKIINARTDDDFNYGKQDIENEMLQNQRELDSLEIKSELLSSDINKNPTITTSVVKPMGIDTLGKPIYAIEQNLEPNPKQKDRDRLNTRIDVLRANLDNNYKRLQGLRDSLWIKNKENVGILTELEVTFSKDVVFSGWPSGIFYLLFFLLFILVECFVVTGKVFSKRSDYEILVEHQQARKIKQIESILPIEKDKG